MKNQSIVTSDEVIRLENVSFYRNSQTILDKINWSIKSGEHWSLVGLNGSGKSTIINILSGYHFPSNGKVWVLEEEFGKTSIPLLRQRIGIVSNWINQQLPKNYNVLKTIISGKFASFGIYQEITDEDKEKALSLLKQFGFERFAHRPLNTLSQGEMQKVLIIRALMTDPELLILDEPANSLDLFAREQLLQFIEELATKKRNMSLLLITHHVEEITPLFKNTLLLKNGKSFRQGNTNELMNPQTLYEFYDRPIEIVPYVNNRVQVIPSMKESNN